MAWADPHEARIAQHAQMPGGAWLAPAQLLHKFADRAGTLEQKVENVTPGRLGYNVEHFCHDLNIPFQLYK